MKRTTFMNFPHTSDCCEVNEVVVERILTPSPSWDSVWMDESFRLLSFPSVCKCGHPIHVAEPSQTELAEAYNQGEEV